MRIIFKTFGATILLALIYVAATTSVMAQRQYRDSDTNMRTLIQRIETRSDTFSRTLENALDGSRLNNTDREDEINRLVRDFEYAADQLKTRFESRQSTSTDARAVLDKAALINSFLMNNRLETRVDQDWRLLQSDLDLLARAYYINDWRWNTGAINTGTAVGYQLSDAELRQLARRINNRTLRFSRSLRMALNRSSIDGTSEEDEASRNLIALESATNQLAIRINTRRFTQSDVRNVLERATPLNSLMVNHEFNAGAKQDWTMLKQDLDQLSSASNIAWHSNTGSMPGGPIYSGDGELTGTYRLDTSRSADVRRTAENATRNLPDSQRQRVYDSLLRRLDSPETMAIERRGNTVSIASSRASRISFVADGREHVETTPNGGSVRVRASFSGDQLNIVRTGDRAQDFTVTFDPTDSGRRLMVTRRLYSDQISQPVTVMSYYDRTSDVAQLDMSTGTSDYPQGTASGEFVIPNGTQLVAVLNSNLSTNTARDNERFTMSVRSPAQYDGATIEGYLTNVNRSGRVTGRSEMTLNFDTIRLRDGRSYKFAGIVETARTPENETVRVDNEGAVRENDQTGRTIQRTAIGTALGAIIGAIAGGGKGAAIGAVLGAGTGAGSVYVQGREDLELTTGTEFTIRASGPR